MTTVYLNPSYDGHFARKQQPTRPLSTIDLDQDLKKDLVADMSRFLSPSREAYYSARGIPYRRGYLFHGPPGTGKSSTSKALAGHFNADLYIINLADVRSDATLRTLFDRASKGDIVLLEDIDSANISRENMHQASNSLDGPPAPGVSLSGLLNILDGATAKDGIILIMTSNAPESLDKALVRPGRIDKQVLFGNVSKPVAASIFSRMYRDNDDVDAGADARVHDLANAFAECVPEDTLTPAEVQGYFISNEDPVEAARGAGRWVQEMVEAKVGGRNVVGEKGVQCKALNARL
ncbi:P-loop containing nucleoside triphosphate hydrolase protein [Polyplosphaeria fusca]|uniref:P-loop containing nucleoside triphosphate hydrolase protein n=1 Tax=Polyplosphaeria fusca TaxID=682080 RepID=A0A9P4UWM2_9PLEO|nr:P-loop containing nucleoside triphosphate hydrolase protein [Polyplosphaeria fusca]